jgi:hypothetical protein
MLYLALLANFKLGKKLQKVTDFMHFMIQNYARKMIYSRGHWSILLSV